MYQSATLSYFRPPAFSPAEYVLYSMFPGTVISVIFSSYLKKNIFYGQCHSFCIFISYMYSSIEVDEKIYAYNFFGWGLLEVLSTRCGLAAWMHWSCIDEIVFKGFKFVE